MRRMIRISGVHNYSPEDLETALAFLAVAVDRYPFGELAGPGYPLREVNSRYRVRRNRESAARISLSHKRPNWQKVSRHCR